MELGNPSVYVLSISLIKLTHIHCGGMVDRLLPPCLLRHKGGVTCLAAGRIKAGSRKAVAGLSGTALPNSPVCLLAEVEVLKLFGFRGLPYSYLEGKILNILCVKDAHTQTHTKSAECKSHVIIQQVTD